MASPWSSPSAASRSRSSCPFAKTSAKHVASAAWRGPFSTWLPTKSSFRLPLGCPGMPRVSSRDSGARDAAATVRHRDAELRARRPHQAVPQPTGARPGAPSGRAEHRAARLLGGPRRVGRPDRSRARRAPRGPRRPARRWQAGARNRFGGPAGAGPQEAPLVAGVRRRLARPPRLPRRASWSSP